MEFIIIALILGLLAVVTFWFLYTDYKESKEKERVEKIRKIQQISFEIKHLEDEIAEKKENIDTYLTEHFSRQNITYKECIVFLKKEIATMTMLNNQIFKKNTEIDGLIIQNNLSLKNQSNNGVDISKHNQYLNQMEYLYKTIKNSETNLIVEKNEYGKINHSILEKIRSYSREKVALAVKGYYEALKKPKKFEYILNCDCQQWLEYVWYYALSKPFSAEDFEKAKDIYYCLFKEMNIEVFIAELYAIKQMGGSDILRKKINDFLREEKKNGVKISQVDIYGIESLPILASGLMWMQAYEEEKTILQYLIEKKVEITSKMQERFHSLSNGGGNVSNIYSVSTTEETVYLDVEPLSWNEKDYHLFFDNLAFQNKTLNYSFAVRSDSVDIALQQNRSLPELSNICKKIKNVFEMEYSDEANVEQKDCILLSQNEEERLIGLLMTTSRYNQLAIYMNLAKIGRKISVKFYTLYVPNKGDTNRQKQTVMSLYKRMSPVVESWENSLKETALIGLQQLLNETSTTYSSNTTDKSNIEF